MALTLYKQDNYVIYEDTISGVKGEYAINHAVYREEADRFIIKEQIDGGRLTIMKADVDAGKWTDGVTPYTQETLRTFLQQNTGFNTAAGGSAAGPTLTGQYTAILTNPGVTPPSANILFNSLGGEVVWTRSSPGFYIGTLANAFPTIEKTIINNSADSVSDGAELHPFGATSITGYYAFGWLNANSIYVLTYNTSFAFAEWKDVIGSARLFMDLKVFE